MKKIKTKKVDIIKIISTLIKLGEIMYKLYVLYNLLSYFLITFFDLT